MNNFPKDHIFYAEEFLAHKTIDDASALAIGELPEFCTENATYYYGNGELIVLPVDSEEEIYFDVNKYNGFTKVLVLI